jgi:hypothetical protein
LHVEQVGMAHGQAQAPQAELGVAFRPGGEEGHRLVAADVEGADDQAPSPEHRPQPAQQVCLLLERGGVAPVHVEQFGAQQADGLGPLLEGGGQLLGAADVGRHLDPPAVPGGGRALPGEFPERRTG